MSGPAAPPAMPRTVTPGREGRRPYTLVFDGDCRICTRLVGLLRRWDEKGEIEIVPSTAPGIAARFPWIPAKAYQDSMQLVGPADNTWEGAQAVERLLDVLPKGRLVSWVFALPLARPAAARFYRWFARNRYRLGCGDHCRYHPAEPRDRHR